MPSNNQENESMAKKITKTTEPSPAEAALMAQLEELKRERDELKAKAHARANQALSFKVSEKGAVSVYGLGRFPVTLYGEQWPKLLNAAPAILAFIEAHKAELSVKGANKNTTAQS